MEKHAWLEAAPAAWDICHAGSRERKQWRYGRKMNPARDQYGPYGTARRTAVPGQSDTREPGCHEGPCMDSLGVSLAEYRVMVFSCVISPAWKVVLCLPN